MLYTHSQAFVLQKEDVREIHLDHSDYCDGWMNSFSIMNMLAFHLMCLST